MTIEQIIEGNRLIAEFMGGRPFYSDRTCTEVVAYFGIHDKPAQTYFDDLEYHSSWDWLMPVLEKIQSLNYVYEICNGACRIKIPTDRGWWLEETTIKSVFSAVVEFIKWYNSNEKN